MLLNRQKDVVWLSKRDKRDVGCVLFVSVTRRVLSQLIMKISEGDAWSPLSSCFPRRDLFHDGRLQTAFAFHS